MQLVKWDKSALLSMIGTLETCRMALSYVHASHVAPASGQRTRPAATRSVTLLRQCKDQAVHTKMTGLDPYHEPILQTLLKSCRPPEVPSLPPVA